MPLPDLPVDVAKGEIVRTASTPSEYWNLVARGFTAENLEEQLTPQQKAARTRAQHKAEEEQQSSQEGPTDTAGNATGDES